MNKFLLIIGLFFICNSNSVAQSATKAYKDVDEYVHQLGSLDSFNVATIADTLTQQFSDKEKKARAVFFWIANNIALDPKAIRANDNKKTDPVTVIQFRKTTTLGFATLVQEMCSMANIRCLVVDGYTKRNAEDINNKSDEINHSWNVVQLGQSPEEWYYIDAAKASGQLDGKLTVFTKRFTTGYFFADKKLFNLDHFPDNHAWLLGEGPKGIKDFYALPVIGNAAYTIGLQKPLPATGYFKAKTTGTTRFSFKYNESHSIKNISIIIGEGNKQLKPEEVSFSDGAGEISFSYKFKKDDSYPFKILADGEELLIYYAEVTE